MNFYRKRFEHYGHGTAKQAIVGLGGHAYIAKRSQDAFTEFRPYFQHNPFGFNSPLEDIASGTPMSVGSPQEVIDKTLGFHDQFGDYQRQLWLLDGMGLPLPAVLKQIDLLAEEVVPVLRKELEARRDPEVPDAPTHQSLVRAKYGDQPPRQPRPNPNRGDNLTGTSPYQDSESATGAIYPAL